MRVVLKAGSVVLLLLLAACAASGPRFSEIAPAAADSGRIYVYRNNTLVGAAYTAHVVVDNASPQKLKTGGFVYFDLAPGRHEVAIRDDKRASLDTDQSATVVLVAAGQAVFVKFANHPTDLSAGAGANSFDLTEVPVSTGLDEIHDIRQSQ